MEIYILRHGIAEPAGRRAADSERKLTEEGQGKLRLLLAIASHRAASPVG